MVNPGRKVDVSRGALTIIKRLHSDSPEVRRAALEACQLMMNNRNPNQEIQRAVLGLTANPTAEAARAVGMLAIPDDRVMNRLVELTSFEDVEIQTAALLSLADYQNMVFEILSAQQIMQSQPQPQPQNRGQIIVPQAAIPPHALR